MFAQFITKAQNPLQISIQNTTLAATDSVMPFWFAANQHGKVQPLNSFLNISDLYIGQAYNNKTASNLTYTWGGNFVAAFGETNYYQVNRAFAGLALKGWELKGGLFYNEIKYAGLSTSNGIIGRSDNALPVPRVRISTLGYRPFLFAKNWFSFKFEYEEGWLNDERYVDKAHLHHKSLYGKIQPASSWNIQIGFEHFAIWGGTSQNEKIGEMPGWENYWYYVFALPGNEDFPEGEQLNNSGNQLGSYQLQVEKEFSYASLTFYLSHPWEDNSGLNWHNWQDNILGLYLNFKKEKSWITDILYEFTNIRQERYFNHYIYRSGFTYQQQVLGSPLFFPVVKQNNISMGILSTQFFAHHLGLKGNILEHVLWKGMLTYLQHQGTYGVLYEPVQKQLSGLLEIQYVNPGFPLEIVLAAGADAGNTIENNLGLRVSLAKKW